MSTFLSILPIIIALVLYFTGIPIAYALFAAALTYFGFIDTTTVPYLLMQKFITSTQSFPFLAIPFFIMCGSIMNYGGISARLMDFADALTGHLPGGLAQINVLLSMLMGGCSGSANADAAMECKLLVPEMEKRGYGKGFSAAITAASSCVTPIIPPGINLIVYGLIAGASVGQLFAAGYIPGLLMAVTLMIAVAIVTMVSGLLIIILERTQMIGVLKALGAKNQQVRHVFLWFATFVLAKGLLWGNALGLGLIALQHLTGFVRLDPQTYYVSTVPVEISWPIVLALNVATLLVCVAALVVPSFLVSRIHPAKSMHYE